MTSTSTPTRTRRLAANAVGRPLLSLIQTMLAGPASTGRPGARTQLPDRRRS